ncbi:MAG: hypothetical protein ABIK60_03405 [candidate division WOR-3 bacterium]
MSEIEIGRYTFDIYYSTEDIEDRSGVYAILDKRKDGYYLIDVGESAQVKTRIESHDRKACWESHCQGKIVYGVYYTPYLQQAGRREIEQEIRDQYNIPCGEY